GVRRAGVTARPHALHAPTMPWDGWYARRCPHPHWEPAAGERGGPSRARRSDLAASRGSPGEEPKIVACDLRTWEQWAGRSNVREHTRGRRPRGRGAERGAGAAGSQHVVNSATPPFK